MVGGGVGTPHSGAAAIASWCPGDINLNAIDFWQQTIGRLIETT